MSARKKRQRQQRAKIRAAGPRPTCPLCGAQLAQTSNHGGHALYSCVNYSGGCTNTRQLYHHDGSPA